MTQQTALFNPEPTPAPTDRHWFIPDRLEGVYCAACGLPRANRRHAERKAA